MQHPNALGPGRTSQPNPDTAPGLEMNLGLSQRELRGALGGHFQRSTSTVELSEKNGPMALGPKWMLLFLQNTIFVFF